MQLRGSSLHAIEIGDPNLNATANIRQTHMGNSTPHHLPRRAQNDPDAQK